VVGALLLGSASRSLSGAGLRWGWWGLGRKASVQLRSDVALLQGSQEILGLFVGGPPVLVGPGILLQLRTELLQTGEIFLQLGVPLLLAFIGEPVAGAAQETTAARRQVQQTSPPAAAGTGKPQALPLEGGGGEGKRDRVVQVIPVAVWSTVRKIVA